MGCRACFWVQCYICRALLEFAQSKQTCRTGWKVERARLADACTRYIELASRNPRAKAVAAWVIYAFALEDLSALVPAACPM